MRQPTPRRCFYCNKRFRTRDKVHWVPEFIIVGDRPQVRDETVKVLLTSKELRPWCDRCYRKVFSREPGPRFLKLLHEMREEVISGEKG